MAPVRSKQKESSSDGKKSSKHRRPREFGQKDPSALPGVQKIKASIRQTRRLLAKNTLAADVRVESERRLKALESDLQKAELARKTRHLAVKYHKVKFFERQKVLRKINQTKRRLASSDLNSNDLQTALYELRVDLNYILHYPKTNKYVALFPPEVRKGNVPLLEAEVAKTNKQREEIRSWIKTKMEEGEISAIPDENMESRNVGVTMVHSHASGNEGKTRKLDETPATKIAEAIEQDTFFGDDDDADESDSASE